MLIDDGEWNAEDWSQTRVEAQEPKQGAEDETNSSEAIQIEVRDAKQRDEDAATDEDLVDVQDATQGGEDRLIDDGELNADDWGQIRVEALNSKQGAADETNSNESNLVEVQEAGQGAEDTAIDNDLVDVQDAKQGGEDMVTDDGEWNADDWSQIHIEAQNTRQGAADGANSSEANL